MKDEMDTANGVGELEGIGMGTMLSYVGFQKDLRICLIVFWRVR